MKTTILLLLGGLLFTGIIQAQSGSAKFEIEMLTPGKKDLFVDRSWQPTADCIEAKFSADASIPFKDIQLKAYFFGANDKLIETVGEPSFEGNHRGGTVKLPVMVEHGKRYSVYFGVPGAVNSPGSKWKRVIVVIGKPGAYAVKIYPKDDIAKFDFPEKAQANPAK
jgi:hypothetical protein